MQNQEQAVGDIQIQGDRNVLNVIQGQDVQIVNLTVCDRLPVGFEHLHNSASQPSPQAAYFCTVLLNKVKQYWIQGVLEKSLYARVLIELKLEERLDALHDPFNALQAIPEQSQRTQLDKSVLDVFHQMGGGKTLLILGEPGSGKTITLLRLAKDLITRYEQRLSQTIPVVLNLASWAIKCLPIDKWLVAELSSKYQVSKKLGKTWVTEQSLLLLLDGLDEVKAERRDACIQALNQFMQEYGQTELVVCSRLKDYEALSSRLRLQAAICVQSLNAEQVNLYLQAAGDQLGALRRLLKQDEALQELAKSPLMLSVMSLAYQNKSEEDLPHGDSVEQSRWHLFDAYIKQMLLRRRGKNRRYSDARMISGLSQLARKLSGDSQTIFLIERMQPNWLRSGNQIWLYRIAVGFMSALAGGVVLGLTGSLSGGLSCPDNRLRWNSQDALEWGVVTTLVGAVMGALIVTVGKKEIKPVEAFEISLGSLSRSLMSRHTLTRGIAGGLIGAAGLGLCSWLTGQLVHGALLGLSWGMGFGLALGVSSGLTGSEIEAKTKPNQGIWRSALNAVWVGVIFGLMITLLAQMGFALMGISSTCRWMAGLLIFLGFGGLGVLVNEAGKACLRHFALRLVLLSQGIVPWNYSQFLDRAVENVFLQRVGGYYIFVHRTLMEYFARIEF